jgi:GT2 family glycosyltransferase
MDEGFQHSWHDIDFCLQARLVGWQTKYTPYSVCLTLEAEGEKDAADRLRFYGKWVGNLWPNEECYWQEDGVDNRMLAQLYQNQIR